MDWAKEDAVSVNSRELVELSALRHAHCPVAFAR
jgi:hypothetical protein